MAVYTKVPEKQLKELLENYAIGHLASSREILEGVENSNFFIETITTRAILTLYERRVREADLPYFIELMRHLAGKGLSCPLPIPNKNGKVLQRVNDRPAALMSFINGRPAAQITPSHCQQVGKVLGELHMAASDFPLRRNNDLSLPGWVQLANLCKDRADSVAPGLGKLIAEELAYLEAVWPLEEQIPFGAIHADLFPDNVFFDGGRLCGIIDFYFACTDFLAYDLAICINAWCFAGSAFEAQRANALFGAYGSTRFMNAHERKVLPVLLRGAALRFLLTRLHDLLHHPAGAKVTPKDPLEYRDKLLFFRDNPGLFQMQAA